MKPQFDKIETGCRAYIGNSQTVTETFLGIKDAQDIRVLTVCAEPTSVTGENLSGEARYAGKLNIKTVITDGDGNISGHSFTADFGGTFVNAAVSPDVKLTFQPYVVDTSYKAESGGIYVKCVVETRVYSNDRDEQDVVTGCEDINCKTCEVETAEQKAAVCSSFVVSDEVEVKHRIGKILMAQSAAVLTSAVCGDDSVTVKGNIYTCVTYQAGESDIKSVMTETPFEEELAAEGSDVDCVARAKVESADTKIRVEIAEEGDNKTFTAETTLTVTVKCYLARKQTVVTDAFSMADELELVSRTFTDCLPCDYFAFTKNVSGTAESDGRPDVDEILCVSCPRVNIVGCRSEGRVTTVEGIVTGTLLYLGEEAINSIDFEIPFVTDSDCPDAAVCGVVNAAVSQVSAKLVRGSVNVDASVRIGVGCDRVNRFTAVTEINVIGARQNCGCAIEVVSLRQGTTEWDLQKMTGLTMDEIKACNPDLVLPAEKDCKALIYRQIK